MDDLADRRRHARERNSSYEDMRRADPDELCQRVVRPWTAKQALGSAAPATRQSDRWRRLLDRSVTTG